MFLWSFCLSVSKLTFSENKPRIQTLTKLPSKYLSVINFHYSYQWLDSKFYFVKIDNVFTKIWKTFAYLLQYSNTYLLYFLFNLYRTQNFLCVQSETKMPYFLGILYSFLESLVQKVHITFICFVVVDVFSLDQYFYSKLTKYS